LSGRFHGNQWLTFVCGRLKDLPFKQIDPRPIVLERFQGCNDNTFWRYRSSSVFSFADVDTNDIAMIDFYCIGFGFSFFGIVKTL